MLSVNGDLLRTIAPRQSGIRAQHQALIIEEVGKSLAETPRSPLGAGQAQCGRNIQKNRCRTTVVSRFGETLAKLPFTGD
jgi:hypothetical protein